MLGGLQWALIWYRPETGECPGTRDRLAGAMTEILQHTLAARPTHDEMSGPLGVLVKDTDLGGQQVALHQAKVQFAGICAALFRQCRERGWGAKDMSIVLKLQAEPNAIASE